MIKENKNKEFICRRCSLLLDIDELEEGMCPSCRDDRHILFNIS
jgi:rubrerythrin